ncbi:interleukin-6-like [Anableps anableps]
MSAPPSGSHVPLLGGLLPDLRLLAALMLAAALPLCVPGAPLKDAPTDLYPEETSGEEEEEVQRISYLPAAINITETLERVIGAIRRREEEFKNEFQGNVEYSSLNTYKRSSFPTECPKSNFSKEACLQWLAEGLLKSSVLLKYVDREHHNHSIVTLVNGIIPLLITKIKQTMRNADRVVALTSSQEQQMLKELESPDLFHRKMMAYSILSSIGHLLVDCKRSFRKWETAKRQVVGTKGKQISNLKEIKAN